VKKLLLDTCAISELVKTNPSPSFISWISVQDEDFLYLSVITIGEIFCGVSKLPNGKKRDKLLDWVGAELPERFYGRIIPVGVEVAAKWGELCGSSERIGAKLPVVDSLIAATAMAHGMEVVTRNTDDFKRCGATVLNPWDGSV